MKATSTGLVNVMEQLEQHGSEGTRRIYEKMGAGTNQFGVKLGDLRAMARKIKINHPLALELWATGNFDARMLATMVMAPGELSKKQILAMMEDITFYRLLDEWVENVVLPSPFAQELQETWIHSNQELQGRAGWNLAFHRAILGSDDINLDNLLTTIEKDLLSGPVRKQEAMTRCIVEIAVHYPAYTQRCIDLGERLGRYDQRPVPKGCTPFYAPDWIAAVLKRQGKKAAK